ncbi:MAG: hypothetical protein LBG80_13345 [Bacteroidales bacterium]|jgi:hypothetical protein|nr:hypothetical protein [Bacteroidales bacterium]
MKYSNSGISMLIICIFLCITSCKSKTSEEIEIEIEKDYLVKTIEKITMDTTYQWIVILPGLGCHGCIQEAEYFMRQYITKRQILFVLTKISSLKILQQKTEVNVNEHPNVYVDRSSLVSIPTRNNIYPCIIQLKEGKILNHSFQRPGNDAFHKLERIVSKY